MALFAFPYRSRQLLFSQLLSGSLLDAASCNFKGPSQNFKELFGCRR